MRPACGFSAHRARAIHVAGGVPRIYRVVVTIEERTVLHESVRDELFSDILCEVNGSRGAYEAVRQAALLGGAKATLTLLAVTAVQGSGRSRTAAIAPPRAERALAHAHELAETLGVGSVTAIDERSPVMDVLFEHAHSHRLLAIGPPVMARSAHALLGGTATVAAHALPASLLIARRPPPNGGFGKRLLVASDMLEPSDALVDLAIAIAIEHDASLTLVHVPHSESHHHPTRVAGQVERVTRALGARGTVRIEPGWPLEIVLATAKAERSSLLIVGSRRHGSLRAIGSVSERAVADARCSVLVVRPEDLGVAFN